MLIVGIPSDASQCRWCPDPVARTPSSTPSARTADIPYRKQRPQPGSMTPTSFTDSGPVIFSTSETHSLGGGKAKVRRRTAPAFASRSQPKTRLLMNLARQARRSTGCPDPAAGAAAGSGEDEGCEAIVVFIRFSPLKYLKLKPDTATPPPLAQRWDREK